MVQRRNAGSVVRSAIDAGQRVGDRLELITQAQDLVLDDVAVDVLRTWKYEGVRPVRNSGNVMLGRCNRIAHLGGRLTLTTEELANRWGLRLESPKRAVRNGCSPVRPIIPGAVRRARPRDRSGTASDTVAASDDRFRQFLDAIEEAVPAELAVLDNSVTHKTPAIRDWLLKHERFAFRFNRTSSSWVILVERWFVELTNTTHNDARRTSRSLR